MPTYANIGGTRKTVSSWYNNIGGARKEIQTMYANVGNTRKIIYESGTDYWSIPYSDSGTLSSSTRYSRMASTSATVNSSGTFTLQNATSTKGRPAAGTFMVKVNNGSSTTTTGTILYYFYNSTGGYYAFNTNVSNTSSTAVSRVTSSTYSTDVTYDTSTSKLLLKRILVPNYYRWDEYEAITEYYQTKYGSGTAFAALGLEGDYVNCFNSYEIDQLSGSFVVTDYYNYSSYEITGIGYSLMRGYSYISTGYPYNTGNGIKTDIFYTGAVISEMDDMYSFTYTARYAINSRNVVGSFQNYVFSPNTSAYSGSYYKNKTTL